jgi:hypothetical protein
MRLSGRVRVFLDDDKVIVLTQKTHNFGPGIRVARMQDAIVGGWWSVHIFGESLAPLNQLCVALAGTYGWRC